MEAGGGGDCVSLGVRELPQALVPGGTAALAESSVRAARLQGSEA